LAHPDKFRPCAGSAAPGRLPVIKPVNRFIRAGNPASLPYSETHANRTTGTCCLPTVFIGARRQSSGWLAAPPRSKSGLNAVATNLSNGNKRDKSES